MTERNNNSGFIIASLVISMTLVLLVMTSVFVLVGNTFRAGATEIYRVNAQLAADAGIDSAITELNLDALWTGTPGEVVLYDEADMRTTYQIDIDPGPTSSERVMTATGRAFRAGETTNPISTRSYQVDMQSLGDSSGTFAIVTGVGGLIMENSAKIVDGDVYVNGGITMSNKSQIGTTLNSVNVRAAHFSCPIGGGGSYPQQCTSSDGEPIETNHSATIFGQVCANNQTDPSGIDTNGGNGLYEVGIDPECGPDDPVPTLDLPEHLRSDQIANVAFEAGVNTAESKAWYTDCDATGAPGQRIWQGPLKIDGDVSIKKQCEITIVGDVWITGRLELEQSAQIIVADGISLGGTNTVDPDYPTIMVDGSGGISFRNSSQVVSNSTDTGAQLITYWSQASCSPGCNNVNGDDLYDSSLIPTITMENSAQAPDSILYAKWSQVDMNNGGDIGALVGQTVKLRNSAAVTFGASLGGGGGGGGGTPQVWLVENYRRVFQ